MEGEALGRHHRAAQGVPPLPPLLLPSPGLRFFVATPRSCAGIDSSCSTPTQVHDAAELGEWVHAMRQARRRGRLPPHAVAALVELGFTWEVDVVTAKWYHNLHAARHYKVGAGKQGGQADLDGLDRCCWWLLLVPCIVAVGLGQLLYALHLLSTCIAHMPVLSRHAS